MGVKTGNCRRTWLASGSRTGNTRYQGLEFKRHVGQRDYLKTTTSFLVSSNCQLVSSNSHFTRGLSELLALLPFKAKEMKTQRVKPSTSRVHQEPALEPRLAGSHLTPAFPSLGCAAAPALRQNGEPPTGTQVHHLRTIPGQGEGHSRF